MTNEHRESISGLGLGFNARPAEPTPSLPAPKPASEGASTAQTTGSYAGHGKTPHYPESRSSLAMNPSFTNISKTIGKQLERDERERRAIADKALGIAAKTPEQALHEQLVKAIEKGQLTADEATQFFNLKFRKK